MPDLRAYMPGLVFVAGCAMVWQSRSQVAMPLSGSLDSIMRDVPGYVVKDQRIGDDERRVAGMTDYVARAYVRDSAVAFTTLVSYYDRQTQGKTIHSPKNCLPGAGWDVVDAGREVVTVDGKVHVVNRYLLRKDQSTALAYYWYQGRGRITASEYQVKWNLLRDAALLGHTEEALVRVVVPVNRSGLADAEDTARRVAGRMVKEVGSVLPEARRGS